MNSYNTNFVYFNNLKIIENCNFYDAKKFIESNPIANKTFRYFTFRDETCFKNHKFNLMIYDKNIPVGYGHLDFCNEITWLGIAIADFAHGKKLGQFILNKLIDKAYELNINKIRLSVDSDNKNAIKLYLNNNFKYFNMNESTIFYELILEN